MALRFLSFCGVIGRKRLFLMKSLLFKKHREVTGGRHQSAGWYSRVDTSDLHRYRPDAGLFVISIDLFRCGLTSGKTENHLSYGHLEVKLIWTQDALIYISCVCMSLF